MPVIFEQDQFRMQAQFFAWPQKGSDIQTAGADLVNELSRVGWEVPGITVEFVTAGEGNHLLRRVYRISGSTEDGPFELCFTNEQARFGRFYVMTGLGRATVPPGIELELYDDHSPTVVHRYVGDDWKADGGAFIRNLKVNSKLNGLPRTYVTYKGHQIALEACTDLGREYGPAAGEPDYLIKDEMIDSVVSFIRNTLLPRLAAIPSAEGHDDVTDEGDANLRRLSKVEAIPAPTDFPTLYAWIKGDNAARLVSAREPDENREGSHVLTGSGYRLVPLGVKCDRDTLHPRANDGFDYASPDPTVRAGQVVHGLREDSFPVEIKLKSLNDVFVVDNAAFRIARDERVERALSQGRDRITDEELNEAIVATARTMVPATEYVGGYEEPTYLIGRQVFDDEARLMHGPVEIRKNGSGTSVVFADAETDLEMQLYPGRHGTFTRYREEAERFARDAALMFAQADAVSTPTVPVGGP